MWYFVLCLFLLPMPYADGSIADEMAETMHLCCDHGTTYARNHMVEICSSSVLPQVSVSFDQLCRFAMDQCCKEYLTKKIDCENGIDIAKSLKSCESANDSAKLCCHQCKSGVILGKIRGATSCSVTVHGKSAEQILAGEAFAQCCKDAVKDSSDSQEINRNSVNLSKPAEKDLSTLASVCEDYEPNDLCAHHCISIPGSYKCLCNPGFILMSDGRSCKKVTKNRCKPHNPCHHKCNDSGIKLTCSCRRGYQLMDDKKSCEDINECLMGKDDCNKLSQFCINTRGSFHCQDKGSKHCPPGFKNNAITNKCEDLPTLASVCEDYEPNDLCAHHCIPIPGSYKCLCNPGFILMSDGRSCKKVTRNRCKPHNPCHHKCNDNGIELTCFCRRGYQLMADKKSCEDIDECALGTHNCDPSPEYQCVNIPGSFRCQKKPAPVPAPEYEYEYDDIEETIEEESNALNNTNSEIITTIAPITTTVEMKTVLILKPTEPTPGKSKLIPIPETNIFDIIQPSMEPNYLSQPVVSQTHELEYKPTVELEYKPTEPEYKSTATTNPEKKTTEIKYSPEPYSITSETTYSPISEKPTSPIVVTISTTEETATKKGHKNEEGSVVFDMSKVLKDKSSIINEKASDSQEGCEMDHYGACFDIDKCATNRRSCSSLTESSLNTMSSPSTTTSITTSTTTSITTSTTSSTTTITTTIYPKLNSNAIISSIKGGINITKLEMKQTGDRGAIHECPQGYRLSSNNTCEDLDECTTGEAQCGPLQLCTNLLGGYTCSCPLGLRLVGDHQCEDIDECSLGDALACTQHADCVNTMGSYQCHCHKGFKLAPINDKVCVDVDECLEAQAGTLCEQRCNNVWGTYRCTCHRGYRLNADNRTCSDVDECKEYKHKRLCIGRCLNEPGSYRCSCPPGYRLADDKISCVDIDECETGEAPCTGDVMSDGVSNVCLNTRGGYRCHRITCPPGYHLQNKYHCYITQTYCPRADWECSHKPSSYSYNFFTFVSNLFIPDSKVELFTMRGPSWHNARFIFQLRVVRVDAPPSVAKPADIFAFSLVQSGNQAVVSLVRPLIGPQSIELELSMELYIGEQFGEIAVAKLFIYVSEYEF